MKFKKNMVMICLFLIINIIFIDFVKAESYNNYSCEIVSCGSNLIDNIPKLLPKVISILYTAIQVAVPVLLVIFGMLDLMKGITAQKEDEIKKGQQMLIKRVISAVLVFFVFVIVKLVISFAADSSGSKIMECTECFIKNECEVRQCAGS